MRCLWIWSKLNIRANQTEREREELTGEEEEERWQLWEAWVESDLSSSWGEEDSPLMEPRVGPTDAVIIL